MNNMVIRIIVALIAAPLILFSPFPGMNYFASFIFLVAFLSSKEFLAFYKHKHIDLNSLLPYMVSLIPIVFLTAGFAVMSEYVILTALILFTIEIFRSKEKITSALSAYLLIIVYCGVFPTLLISVVDSTIPVMFIFIYGVIIATDSFAYFGGVLCSRIFRTHKLAVTISPNKTVEGSFIGFSFAVLTGWLIVSNTELKFIINTEHSLILSALISAFGQIGDLFESMIKRNFKVKDSSNIIPGHGGVLDRFDSLIFVSPLIYFYVKYLLN